MLERGSDYKLEGGRAHNNDMQCIGHTKEILEKAGNWVAAEEIKNDHTWTRTPTSEDDYLIRNFKNILGHNFCKDLPDITFLYYGRAACQNLDNDYDNKLNEDDLFIYPEIILNKN